MNKKQYKNDDAIERYRNLLHISQYQKKVTAGKLSEICYFCYFLTKQFFYNHIVESVFRKASISFAVTEFVIETDSTGA